MHIIFFRDCLTRNLQHLSFSVSAGASAGPTAPQELGYYWKYLVSVTSRRVTCCALNTHVALTTVTEVYEGR